MVAVGGVVCDFSWAHAGSNLVEDTVVWVDSVSVESECSGGPECVASAATTLIGIGRADLGVTCSTEHSYCGDAVSAVA